MRTILLALAGLALPALAGAQNRFPPDSLRNVQVLPRTTTPRQLVTTMRLITSALGVRCTYCHVGEESQPLEAYDFASDDKRTKRTARLMLQMVNDINQHALTQIPERPAPNREVSCMTCHRGVARPVPLGTLIAEAFTAGGLDSARRAYAGLRERYFGRAAYDFGEPSLVGTSLELRAANRLDEALAVLQVNDEQFQSSNTASNIGETLIMKLDTAAAIRAFRTALQRDSTNATARARLQRLGG